MTSFFCFFFTGLVGTGPVDIFIPDESVTFIIDDETENIHCIYCNSGVGVFNANNISVISWRDRSTWRENNRHAASHGQALSQNVVSSTPRHGWNSSSHQW